ncbi:MAG: hypothetical protein FWD61_00775 [Phycisphaerales bacterium]|nr:hypothetical protein [Phycisphaerales bacterium]
MNGWYWKNRLDRDDLITFAGIWRNTGSATILVPMLFFWIGGAVCGAIVVFRLKEVNDDTIVTLLSLGCGAFLTIAGFLHTGMAVASVAHSTLKKLDDLELRLAALEQKTLPDPPIAP